MKLLEINLFRINRLIGNINPSLQIKIDNIENFNFHSLDIDGYEKHIFPTYNQNEIELKDLFFENIKKSTNTAVIPMLSIEDEFSKFCHVIERPNLYNINTSENLDCLWENMNRKRRQMVERSSEFLEFALVETNSHLINIFIDAYLELQKIRRVPLVNFFDRISLINLMSLDNIKLFCAKNIYSKNSMLFHLIHIKNNKIIEYYFSANTDLEARGYSSFLHWNIIMWTKRNVPNHNIYNLGGGIVKNDGVERFKKEIGGISIQRWYYLYPKQKYVNNTFFPPHANILNTEILTNKN